MLDHATCEEFVRRLPSLLDGEVESGDRVSLDEHLRTCVCCLREYRFERSILDGLRQRIGVMPVPPGLRARIEALLQAQAAEP